MNAETFLKYVIDALVSDPKSVIIKQSKDEMGLLLSVDVASQDMGIVIGKAGETIKAVRHLIRVCGMKENLKFSIKVNEPAGSTKPSKTVYSTENVKDTY